MQETKPEIFLIAEPQINWLAVRRYLHAVGEAEVNGERRTAVEWANRVRMSTNNLTSDAEALCEFMGRACYRSWVPGLNANVTKIREDSFGYLQNVLASKHGSVFEHAQFSFMFANVSRVFTHELVRHRAGVAISQESLRYVRLTDIGFRIPPILEPMRNQVLSIVEELEEFQIAAAEHFGLDDDGVPFHYKKEVTSALRRLAPIGLSTHIGWSANVRTLRHVIAMRTAEGAEEEIRIVFDKVARILRRHSPALFGDFVEIDHPSDPNGVPVWHPQHEKV